MKGNHVISKLGLFWGFHSSCCKKWVKKWQSIMMMAGFEIVPIRVSETGQISPDMSNVRGWLSGGHVHFLQLATRLTEVTRTHAPSRHRSRRCLACWRAARCSWSPSLITPRRCWATIRGFPRRDTIAGGTEHAVETRRDAVFLRYD